MTVIRLLATTLIAGLLCPSLAQDGAVIIRIPDGTTTSCIASSDQIYVTLRRVITERKGGWLTRDNSIGVLINAAVNTSKGDRINFPLMAEVKVQDFREGQISVPIEYSVVSGFALQQPPTTYTGLQVDLTLLNRRGKTAWGTGLEALVEVSKKLPIPNTPIATAASYLLNFANSAVDKEVKAQDKDDKVRSATLALNFDPTGKCGGRAPDGGDWERTGTIAVVQAPKSSGPGLISLSDVNQYCWAAELRPAYILKASKKEQNVACDSPQYKPSYQQVGNNYIGFFVNAVPKPGTLSGAVISASRQAALRRCDSHGIRASECLGEPSK